MIRLGKEYLGTMYDYLHKLLYDYHVIQADETPVRVDKDGRKAGSKSWMWVYHSGYLHPERQIILYEYQKTRNASHPRNFLKDYHQSKLLHTDQSFVSQYLSAMFQYTFRNYIPEQ